MRKDRSPQSIIFSTDPQDDFLIRVATIATRTGDLVAESYIILPDLDQWIRSYERRGFYIKNNMKDGKVQNR